MVEVVALANNKYVLKLRMIEFTLMYVSAFLYCSMQVLVLALLCVLALVVRCCIRVLNSFSTVHCHLCNTKVSFTTW